MYKHTVCRVRSLYKTSGHVQHQHLFTCASIKDCCIYNYVYGFLTKHEVKNAGYRPNSIFYMLMDRDRVEVSKHTKNNSKAVR